MNESFLKFLEQRGAITRGSFSGKSGVSYNVETDLRMAVKKYSDAVYVGRVLYQEIKKNLGFFCPVIGVPETGSFLASFVNSAFYEEEKSDFYTNMLRSKPKEYQRSTESVFSVMPVRNEQQYILLEDDVVTGNTLLHYLQTCIDNDIRISAVVAVFGRNSAKTVKQQCKTISVPYCELIEIE